MPALAGFLGTCGIIALILAARQIRAMHEEDLDQIQGVDPRLTTLLLSAGWPPVAYPRPAGEQAGGVVAGQVSGEPDSVLHGREEL